MKGHLGRKVVGSKPIASQIFIVVKSFLVLIVSVPDIIEIHVRDVYLLYVHIIDLKSAQ